jgi:hypothetical protein
VEDEMTSSFAWTMRLAYSLCVVGAWFSSDAQAQQATTDIALTPILVSGQKTTLPTNAAEQKACIDPETGRLVSPEGRPECKAVVKEPDKGLIEESTEGLTEEPLPDGGTKVDLKGRFKKHGTTPPESLAPGTSGRTAVIDPATGKLVTGQAADKVRVRARVGLRAAIRTYEVNLKELMATAQDVTGLQEQQLTAGAVKVDLKGRFRIPLTAIVRPDGTIVIGHGVPTSDRK